MLYELGQAGSKFKYHHRTIAANSLCNFLFFLKRWSLVFSKLLILFFILQKMRFKYTSQNLTEWEDNVLFDSDDPDFVRSTEELCRAIVPAWNNRQRTSSFTLRGKYLIFWKQLKLSMIRFGNFSILNLNYKVWHIILTIF